MFFSSYKVTYKREILVILKPFPGEQDSHLRLPCVTAPSSNSLFLCVVSRDVQIIAFSIFGPCCDDVIALALALQVGELWRQNSNLKRESTHFEGRGVDPSCEANF